MSGRGPFRIGILVSGQGTSLRSLMGRIADGRLENVEISIAIGSQMGTAALAAAEAAGIPTAVIQPGDHEEVTDFSDAVAAALDGGRAELAVQAGWLPYWRPPQRWRGRVMNLHPSLLPKYGGRGFYGRHVYEAVLRAGEKETGATVHWVDEDYDHGPIIAQRRCPVLPGDTIDTLRERVQAVERDLLPDVIDRIARGAASQAP